MTPNFDQRSAARILDLADPALRPRRPRALAAGALFLAISAFCAHEVVLWGSPDAARAAEMSPAGATNAHAESPEMKQMLSWLSVTGAIAVGSSALAQDAVQWRVEDGGNGHWYQLMLSPTWIDFAAASSIATQYGGQLFTGCGSEFDAAVAITGALSPQYWHFDPPDQWLGPWIGLQLVGNTWGWVDGTGCAFDRWDLSRGQPNWSSPGGETVVFLYTFGPQPLARAHDVTTSRATKSVLIEWSADCNADGIVDYGQIRAGELDDANANNIPDCCEAGTTCGCAADISGNGTVDAVDLAAVLSSWGNAPTGKANADVNRDGIVDAIDLAEVLGAWGVCP